MTLSGPSKSGKSFLLINLALCLANGILWLGYKCTKCKVLYINFEIDPASCCARFQKVAEALGKVPGHDNLKIWNLRGYNTPIEELIPQLITGIGKNLFDAVIIDPLYKMFQSRAIKFDENSAASLALLFCELDRVIEECGCAIIMAGHYSKGLQGAKNCIDRTSGSGVFGRDPDAILAMSELEKTDAGYRLESVLREFPSTVKISLLWKYPLHEIDATLDGEPLKGSVGRRKTCTGDDLLDAFTELDTGAGVPIKKLCEILKCSLITIKRRIKELDKADINEAGLCVKGSMVVANIQNGSE